MPYWYPVKTCRNSIISSSEHRSSGGHRSGCRWSITKVSSGDSDQLKKNIDAFSLSDVATQSLCRRVCIEEDDFFTARGIHAYMLS